MLRKLRRVIIEMTYSSNSGHIGGSLSCIDILYTLYFHIMNTHLIKIKSPDRDILILSKAHCSPALYAILAQADFFPSEYLTKYYVDDGLLPGHLDMTKGSGIEASLGSLGLGAGIGLGFAIAKEKNNNAGHIYVLLGDGECNEGVIWEAVELAGTLNTRNYTIIIDYNHLQVMGRDIIQQQNMAERFSSFGFGVTEINGHEISEIKNALERKNGPHAIVAQTIKGKGVSFMENQADWHDRKLTKEEYETALKELL